MRQSFTGKTFAIKNLRLFAASLLALREPLVLALSNEIDMDKERVLGGKRRLT